MTSNQLNLAGASLAQSVHYLYAFEEAMNGDDIDKIVRAFEAELSALNGE